MDATVAALVKDVEQMDANRETGPSLGDVPKPAEAAAPRPRRPRFGRGRVMLCGDYMNGCCDGKNCDDNHNATGNDAGDVTSNHESTTTGPTTGQDSDQSVDDDWDSEDDISSTMFSGFIRCGYCNMEGHRTTCCPRILCDACGERGHPSTKCLGGQVVDRERCYDCDEEGQVVRNCAKVRCHTCWGF